MDEDSERSLYDVLGVAIDATPADIKKAFRRKAAEFHPDRYKGADADERMAEINKANDVLSDPEKRRKYDEYGDDGDPADKVAYNLFMSRMSDLIDMDDTPDMVGAMYNWLAQQQARLEKNRAAAHADIARLEKRRKTIRRRDGGNSEVEKIFARKIARAQEALESMANQEKVLEKVRPMVAEYEMVLDPKKPERYTYGMPLLGPTITGFGKKPFIP